MNTPSTWRSLLTKCLPVAAALLILGSQLLVPPIIGLADNGDYFNVAQILQLEPPPQYKANRYFQYVVSQWNYDSSSKPFLRLLSSEALLAAPPAFLSRWLSNGNLDLRWVGAMHIAVFLAALALAAPILIRRWWFGLIALLILCDVAYFAVFNSFYMDAASFVFLMLTVAFYLRMNDGRKYAVGFSLALLLFLTSKLQHVYLFVFLVPFLFLDPRTKKAIGRTGRVVLAILVGSTFIGMHRVVPPDYHAFAAYNVIFSELLPHSANPKQLLRELGLPPELRTLAGTTAFDDRSGMRNPESRKSLLARRLHFPLLLYYLRHPSVALRMMETALSECAWERQPGYGHYTKDTGYGPNQASGAFAVWSGTRAGLFTNRPWLYAAFQVLIGLGALWLSYRSQRQILPAVALLLLAAALEFSMSALADCAETTRHLFLFRALMDLLFLTLLALIFLRNDEKKSPSFPH